jgi:hypothetical protein
MSTLTDRLLPDALRRRINRSCRVHSPESAVARAPAPCRIGAYMAAEYGGNLP